MSSTNRKSKEHLLMYAAKNGELTEVKRFLKKSLFSKPVDINADHNLGDIAGSPLSVALEAGHKDIADFLISKGANVVKCNKYEQSPLMLAAGAGYIDLIEMMIDRGAPFDSPYKRPPLHWSIINGQLKAAELLIKKGADTNQEIKDGKYFHRTPLILAVENNEGDIALGFVKLLVSNGADIQKPGREGITILHLAAEKNEKDLVAFALSNGADVNAFCSDWIVGGTPLCFTRAIDCAKILIENGADVNKSNINGEGPLHHAANNWDSEMAILLIHNGANVNAKDKNGFTPLIFACLKATTKKSYDSFPLTNFIRTMVSHSQKLDVHCGGINSPIAVLTRSCFGNLFSDAVNCLRSVPA